MVFNQQSVYLLFACLINENQLCLILSSSKYIREVKQSHFISPQLVNNEDRISVQNEAIYSLLGDSFRFCLDAARIQQN